MIIRNTQHDDDGGDEEEGCTTADRGAAVEQRVSVGWGEKTESSLQL